MKGRCVDVPVSERQIRLMINENDVHVVAHVFDGTVDLGQRQRRLKPVFHGACFGAVSARLCLRVFRAEHALLLKKNASTMNIDHVSMAQIAAPINVRADKVCYPTR